MIKKPVENPAAIHGEALVLQKKEIIVHLLSSETKRLCSDPYFVLRLIRLIYTKFVWNKIASVTANNFLKNGQF